MKALGKGSIASWVQVALVVAWYALWVAAVFLVLAAVGYCAVLLLIQNGVVDPSFLTGGDGEVRLGDEGGGSFTLTYDDPHGATWPVMLPFFLIGAVAIGGSLIIVWRLRKLFESFSTGEPFRRENANHLRVIWITMLAIEVSRIVLGGLTLGLLAAFGDTDNVSLSFEGDPGTWGSILILIVLAEVFREGARMKEEQELTI
jgi:hypothetical protein